MAGLRKNQIALEINTTTGKEHLTFTPQQLRQFKAEVEWALEDYERDLQEERQKVFLAEMKAIREERK